MVETIVGWYLQGNRIVQCFPGGAKWISSIHHTHSCRRQRALQLLDVLEERKLPTNEVVGWERGGRPGNRGLSRKWVWRGLEGRGKLRFSVLLNNMGHGFMLVFIYLEEEPTRELV